MAVSTSVLVVRDVLRIWRSCVMVPVLLLRLEGIVGWVVIERVIDADERGRNMGMRMRVQVVRSMRAVQMRVGV